MQKARTNEAKNERRHAVLNAALDEFFERGFKATRMDDIARRVGLSKGTLYLYFDSKEALFIALLETVAIPNVEMIEKLSATALSAADAIHSLTAFMPHVIRETPMPRVVKVLIADAGSFPDVVRTYRRQVIDRVLSAVAKFLERGHASGELVVDDPQLTARIVVAPVILSAIWRVVFEIDPEARIDLDALFSLHGRMLLRALSVSRAVSEGESP